MSETYETEKIFRQVLEAVEKRDLEAILEFYAEDVVIVDYTDPGNALRGKPAMAEIFQGLWGMFDDLSFEVLGLVADEDQLAVRMVGRGSVAGQSEPVELNYGGFLGFRDGRIASEHNYSDSRQLTGDATT